MRRTVAILSRKRSLHATRRLAEALRARGHRPLVLDTLRCAMILTSERMRMRYRGVELRGLDAAIPRIGASITAYGLAVVRHLQLMDVPVLNRADPIARSRDKLRALQLIGRAGIDVPRTVMAHPRGNLVRLVEEVGGLPAIIKLSRGTQGVGVMIASSLAEARSILATFGGLGEEIVLQELIRESMGRDVRVLVVGDRVVAAMRRTARSTGEFRSNLHRGGEGEVITLPKAYAEAAVRAARIIGLEVAGVDLLESDAGPKIMEVNSSPGFQGLERASGQDVAGAIVDHTLRLAEAHRDGRAPRDGGD